MTWWARSRPHYMVTLDRNWPCPCSLGFDHYPAMRSFLPPTPVTRDPDRDWPGDRWRAAG